MLLVRVTSPAGRRLPRGRGVPVRVRQDQLRDAAADAAGLARGDPRRRHRVDAARDRTAGSGRSTLRPGSSASRPGPGAATNANAVATIAANTIFTNVALTDDGDVWWEGLTEEPPAHLDRLAGPALDARLERACGAPERAVHRTGRAVPDHRRGLGRARRAYRSTRSSSAAAAPPTFRWSPRLSTGTTASSWAPPSPPSRRPRPRDRSASCVGTRSRCCRSPATTWPTTGATGSTSAMPCPASARPAIFQVNWFRRGADGRFLWPGFGENSRVLQVDLRTPGRYG